MVYYTIYYQFKWIHLKIWHVNESQLNIKVKEKKKKKTVKIFDWMLSNWDERNILKIFHMFCPKESSFDFVQSLSNVKKDSQNHLLLQPTTKINKVGTKKVSLKNLICKLFEFWTRYFNRKQNFSVVYQYFKRRFDNDWKKSINQHKNQIKT